MAKTAFRAVRRSGGKLHFQATSKLLLSPFRLLVTLVNEVPGCYTAITFAPVQGFIEKSRKLRDLYGSSFILSYLSSAICDAARDRPNTSAIRGYPVISPALINQTQGTPNQIVIAGAFSQKSSKSAKTALQEAWTKIVEECQKWIEREIETDSRGNRFDYCWRREWGLWKTYAWEFFEATGTTISEARENLNETKRSRDWTAINWQGESSTLSGADGIAYPGMGASRQPKSSNLSSEVAEIEAFYQALSQRLGESIVTPREQLSIPELVKRLVTCSDVVEKLRKVEQPGSYHSLNRWRDTDTDNDPRFWTGWFQGDGDRAGEYLKSKGENPQALNDFSFALREWGQKLESRLSRSPANKQVRDGRIIYAGGDDFLGVLYRNDPSCPLQATDCLTWFYRFAPDVWSQHHQPISASVGFVWAAPNVPQRDVLQHCREAEKSAKTNGRDRLALRVLFNGGNFLEWVCPWRFLPVLQDYCDRTPQNGADTWAHIFNDIAVLEARHAFQGKDREGKLVNDGVEVVLALFNVYFSPDNSPEAVGSAWSGSDQSEFYGLLRDEQCNHAKYWEQAGLWNLYGGAQKYDPKDSQRLKTGILGDRSTFTQNKQPDGELEEAKARQALATWIINLAKVGFHLHRDYGYE